MVCRTGREGNQAVSSEAARFHSKPLYGEQLSQALCPTAAGRTGKGLEWRFAPRGDEPFRAAVRSRVTGGADPLLSSGRDGTELSCDSIPFGDSLDFEPQLFGDVTRRSRLNPRWLDRIFFNLFLRRERGEALRLGRNVKTCSIVLFGVRDNKWRRSLQQREYPWKEFSSESAGSRRELCCIRHYLRISSAPRSG